MPATPSAATRTRASAAAAVVAASLTVAPASASAFSWQDLFKPAQPAPVAAVTEPVTDTTSGVTDTVTDTVDELVDTVAATAATLTESNGCPETPATKAFAKFGDDSDYSLAPGGDFETSAGWKLSGGAKLVSGNENLGVRAGRRSLQLPIGATAVSPEFCVDESNPYFRFVTKPDNAIAGYEAVVLYRNTEGAVNQAQFTSSSAQSWGAGKWAPSSVSPLATKIPLMAGGKTASVQIMFVSTGNKLAVGIGLWGRLAGGSVGTVSVDSVMVDPYRRG